MVASAPEDTLEKKVVEYWTGIVDWKWHELCNTSRSAWSILLKDLVDGEAKQWKKNLENFLVLGLL